MSKVLAPSPTMAGRVPRDGRRCRRRARLAWVLLAADAAAFAAICAFVDFDSGGTALGVTAMALTMVGAISLFAWGVQQSITAQLYVRFERGEKVVASWIVDAETWRERMAFRTRGSGQPARRGTVLLSTKAPPGGIEIVVDGEGIFIGESLFLRASSSWSIPVRIRDDWIELELPADSDSDMDLLSLPIGRDNRAAADQVVRHFGGNSAARSKTAAARGV